MDFWTNWMLLVGVFGVALASPGPDIIMIVRNSLAYSRLAGIMTALGFAAGVLVHITYTLVGLAALISQSIVLFNLIKYAGALYLFYMGYKALRSNGFKIKNTDNQNPATPIIKRRYAFFSGFLTNVLNPKATLFFLAIFSQFITPETIMAEKLILGATCVVMTALWFSFLAVALTQEKIKAIFLKASKWIDRICGTLFIALGLKLIFTKSSVS